MSEPRTDPLPTAEDIAAEPAGRRLDAWVAMAVFGWRWCAVNGGRLVGYHMLQPPVGGEWRRSPDGPGHWAETDAKWPEPQVADWDRGGLLEITRHEFRSGIPRFSTDTAAAWAVVESLAAKGFESAQVHVRPLAVPASRYAATFFQEVPGGGKWTPHTRFAAIGATMPEAVCRAALLALTPPPPDAPSPRPRPTPGG